MIRFIILLFSLIPVLSAQTPLINEIMSLNSSIIADRDGDYPDWLELYNPSPTAVDLTDFSLTDDYSQPRKWVFPYVKIEAHGFLLIFASDKNQLSTEKPLHSNFKLSSLGESIYLFTAAALLADSLQVPPLAVDMSYGRSPDGSDHLVLFLNPSPAASNSGPSGVEFSGSPEFSIPGGFYSAEQQVTIETDAPHSRIVYTTDGSDPHKNSRSYSSPIPIKRTTVLKARLLEDEKLPGPVLTQTFIINESSTIPVVSFSTHPDNLFDDDIGIYVVGNSNAMGGYEDNPIGPPANYWEDWERPVSIEWFEPEGKTGFSCRAGIKMFGKTTRNLAQKSFALFFRNQYGMEELDYPLFPDYPIRRFKSLLLRNGGSDNTDNEGGVQFRDGFAAKLVYDLDLEYQAYRPCHLYINGEYWGIYNVREKINKDYIAEHQGIDADEIDMLDDYHRLYPLVIEGDADHYNALIDFLLAHDLNVRKNAEFVETQMNVRNFLTYMAVQIWLANHDGPGHNCKFWRPREDEGRYRWILYDTDHSFGMRLFIPNYHYAPDAYMDDTIAYYREENGPSWPNPPESTFLFRKILENSSFQHLFINVLADLMNSRFSEDATAGLYLQVKKTIEPEIDRQLQRWGGDKKQWLVNAEVVDDFIANRNSYLQEYIIEEFSLDGLAEIQLAIEPEGAGMLQLNSLTCKSFPWSGIYFKGVPFSLSAIPFAGFRFSDWQGIGETVAASEISITPAGDIKITARFEGTSSPHQLVINEINYHSEDAFDTEDWVELYNPLSAPVNISLWTLADQNNRPLYTFAENSIVQPLDFLIVSRDISAFNKYWPAITSLIGPLLHALNNDGDHLCLRDAAGSVIDSLTFSHRDPWPRNADGNGATLALRNPFFDNSQAENWMASFSHGTPGAPNQIIGSVDAPLMPNRLRIMSAFPNPFNNQIQISFAAPAEEKVSLRIFNLLGRLVRSMDITGAPLTFTWDGTDDVGYPISSGLYFVTLETRRQMETIKILLIR
ncbi:MAG: T9SS C-terminal target domain-containing protein [Calditrichaeota bacterium]|nr:MAG: T9SS C-terminal target domain-containing protein [Calditrichota bacterium]